METGNGGFTLIELMIVVAIIGILSTIALPTFQDRVIRAQIEEALSLSEGVKSAVTEFYAVNRRFPADNAEAGVPRPEFLMGNYVTNVEVRDGAIYVVLGNRINAHVDGKVLTLRPARVVGSPESPMSWLCGYAEPVKGMEARTLNLTDVPDSMLPYACRPWARSPGQTPTA